MPISKKCYAHNLTAYEFLDRGQETPRRQTACQFNETAGGFPSGSLPRCIIETIWSPLSRLSSIDYQGIRKTEVLMIGYAVLRIQDKR